LSLYIYHVNGLCQCIVNVRIQTRLFGNIEYFHVVSIESSIIAIFPGIIKPRWPHLIRLIKTIDNTIKTLTLIRKSSTLYWGWGSYDEEKSNFMFQNDVQSADCISVKFSSSFYQNSISKQIYICLKHYLHLCVCSNSKKSIPCPCPCRTVIKHEFNICTDNLQAVEHKLLIFSD
jgi:hypothetical protein